MKTVRESTTLYNFLGSHNPYWRLTESSDVLRFSTTETTEPERTLQLSAEQAARIREMTVITSSLMMSLTVDESDLSVHLVGRKINKREWAGNASAWHDTPAVARDLSHGLSFAEQVVSEAHSAIVILDSREISNASTGYVKITSGQRTRRRHKACLKLLRAVVAAASVQ